MNELFIKIIADWLVIAVVLVGGFGFFVLVWKDFYQATARGVVAGLTALLFAKIASLLYQGERPFVVLGEEPKAAFLNNPGFPSDHALLVFIITFVVWASTKNRRLTLILLCMSILVAVGRVVALVHTPLDIIGSVVCAFLAVMLVYGRPVVSTKK